MKFTGTLHTIKIDVNDYRERLDKYMKDILVSVVEFWLSVTALGPVPVWSGASRATFTHVALGAGITLPIFPAAPIDRIDQGVEQSAGNVVADPGRGTYYFEYYTSLPWLNVNERYDATLWGFHLINPGPYEFCRKGQEAFLMFAEQVSLPGVCSSVTVSPIRVE